MIYDLSVVLNNNTRAYPSDPHVKLEKYNDIDNCGFNVMKIMMCTHSGTHVDLPLHFISNGIDAASSDIGNFCGEALVMEAYCEAGKSIGADIFNLDEVRKGDILLLRTGWDQKSGESDFFFDCPYFSKEFAEKLVELGVKAVGTDLPSVDSPESNGEAHKKLLSNNIMIIESLVNLAPLVGKRCFFSAVPLKIEQGDGSPVRAYAIV